MEKAALIIFIKNPVLGKVKTRLAATIGDEKALEVFKKLLHHTFEITKNLEIDKFLYYSDFIDEADFWPNNIYFKRLQKPSPDLGERMFSAFEELSCDGYEKVVIIGSDVFENTFEILKIAFSYLDTSDAIIGKAIDGGYYAIGFNFKRIQNAVFLKNFFLGKTWSHENVAAQAMEVIDLFSFTCNFLPTLSDIDIENDLKISSSLHNII